MLNKVEEEGYQKVALLHANDANGTAIGDTYRGLFDGAGIDFVDETFAPTDVDMTAQLQRLQEQDPDVLILLGTRCRRRLRAAEPHQDRLGHPDARVTPTSAPQTSPPSVARPTGTTSRS